jgi:hypothetical protein
MPQISFDEIEFDGLKKKQKTTAQREEELSELVKRLATPTKYKRKADFDKKVSIQNFDPTTLYTQKNTGLAKTVRVWPTVELSQLSPVSVTIDDINLSKGTMGG